MCYTRGAHAGLSSIPGFTGYIWALNWHPTETGWRNRSWLLTHRLSGTLNEAQGALRSLGEHSHEGVNPSVHLGHPTEGEDEDDNRGINNLLQLPNSTLWFQRLASCSQIPKEHFQAEETVPPDRAAHSPLPSRQSPAPVTQWGRSRSICW